MRKAVLILLAFLLSGLPVWAYPPVYIEKAEAIPDLCQNDRSARLPGRGKGYCGPVAVSNSFVYLSQKGFPALLPSMGRRKMTQGQLASLLGMSRYMNTSIKDGTTPAGLLLGVENFLKDRGVNWSYLGYQGWRKHPDEFSADSTAPVIGWIKDGLLGDSAVWLNLGWYKRDEKTGEYLRIGGHWVTLVGYGLNEKGARDPMSLLIHDPATRPPKQASATAPAEAAPLTPQTASCPADFEAPCQTDYVRLVPLGKGTLRAEEGGHVIDAKDFYRLDGVRSMDPAASIAVMDGAVVLKLKKMETLLLTRENPESLSLLQ
ncbi:MAG: hypothetical protein AB1921_01435 [Thermodesulfobacteriota bacterium]